MFLIFRSRVFPGKNVLSFLLRSSLWVIHEWEESRIFRLTRSRMECLKCVNTSSDSGINKLDFFFTRKFEPGKFAFEQNFNRASSKLNPDFLAKKNFSCVIAIFLRCSRIWIFFCFDKNCFETLFPNWSKLFGCQRRLFQSNKLSFNSLS